MEAAVNTLETRLELNTEPATVTLNVLETSNISMDKQIFLTGKLQDPIQALVNGDLVVLKWIFGKPTRSQKLILLTLVVPVDQKDVKIQMTAELLTDIRVGVTWMVAT